MLHAVAYYIHVCIYIINPVQSPKVSKVVEVKRHER